MSSIGRIILRESLRSLLPKDPQLNFGRSETGKPILLSPKYVDIEFNISHHANWIVVGLNEGGLIGVDVMVEKLTAGDTLESFFLAFENYFTPTEWVQIHSCKDPLHQFFVHWVLKEAYLKATGVGITFGLERVEIVPQKKKSNYTIFVDGECLKDWWFEVHEFGDCLYGFAVQNPHTEMNLVHIDSIEQLSELKNQKLFK
eukprot:TRINITY_DN788_c0_g1_i1.p1 TRINITY_DN788_c0_g1~~TRINITY_DN788_c0_g1_i1.p1  ORF type:complete len:201 (+),score=31.17 TRINITY_DN788_c0_g1_i1:303-905(+)